MKELDVLLSRYGKERYPSASVAERAAFEALLALPDPEIADYLLGYGVPADPAVAGIVRTLLARP